MNNRCCEDQGDDDLEAEAPAAPPLGQQGAADQQPGHEGQPDALHLGPAHLGEVRGDDHGHRAGDEPPHGARGGVGATGKSVGDAGEGERTGAEGEGGEVAPHPVLRRAVGRDAVPVPLAEHGQRLPPGVAERHVREDDRERRERRRDDRPPGPRDDQDRHGQQPEQRQAVGDHHAPAEQQPGQRGTTRAARRTSTAASASAHIPQAANAANIASADTHCQIAAGPITRNGAASRACARRRAPQRTAARPPRSRPRQGDDQPGREPAAEPEPHQQHEERQRTRRVAGDVHRPVARRASTGIRLMYIVERVRQVVGGPRGVEVLVRVSRMSPIAVEPVDERERQHPGQPGGVRRPAAAAATTAGPPGRRRTATPERPSTTAGTVPQPTRGSHSACSGGNQRTCTSQSRTAGTAIPRVASSSASDQSRPRRPHAPTVAVSTS